MDRVDGVFDAWWVFELNTKCPACGGYFDILKSEVDVLHEIEPFEEKVINVACPMCKCEFNVHCAI